MYKLTHHVMVNAMQTCDPGYDGRFWVGVKSTGIYCLPSCKAKLPLLKNVTFFETRAEAVAFGLRGCKRCKSEHFPRVAPDWLENVLQFMNARVRSKIDEESLATVGRVDISTIRRYFKSHYMTTPLTFHRKLRLAHAEQMIGEGNDYLTTAYECGFESASGFRDAFIKEYGSPPGAYYKNLAAKNEHHAGR